MTTSWQRQSLFCSHQDYTQICPFTPTSPFVWSFSATDCSQTLASSTLPHTGVFEPVWFSGVWRRQQTEAREDLPFGTCDMNWKSAEEDPDTVTRLNQEDIDGQFRSKAPR